MMSFCPSTLNCSSINGLYTIQDDLLARVIFDEFVCEKHWRILYWQFELPRLSSCLEQWLCGRVNVVINIGDFNIGEFSEKLPITNINSSPINCLVRYRLLLLDFTAH